jgi:hypothetical protein
VISPCSRGDLLQIRLDVALKHPINFTVSCRMRVCERCVNVIGDVRPRIGFHAKANKVMPFSRLDWAVATIGLAEGSWITSNTKLRCDGGSIYEISSRSCCVSWNSPTIIAVDSQSNDIRKYPSPPRSSEKRALEW